MAVNLAGPTTDSPDALPNGTTLREYTIRRVLGQGGFAITYLAHDRLFDREVAIKEFLPTDIARRADTREVAPRTTRLRESFEWGLDAFLKEAQLIDQLDHPNVVRVRAFFRENATAYLVMAYVAGPTLAAWLAEHPPLGTAQLRSLLLPLLQGLDHVHASQCLHRDIKPDNIVLRDGRLEQPVLIDFGAARKAVGERTRSVSAIVSAGYTPLEQYSAHRTLSPASDIYSVCAVAYRCITGEEPPSATDRAIDDGAEVLARTQAARHPLPLLQALDAGFAVRSDARPADTAALRQALGETAAPRPPVGDTSASRQANRDRNTATMIRPFLPDAASPSAAGATAAAARNGRGATGNGGTAASATTAGAPGTATITAMSPDTGAAASTAPARPRRAALPAIWVVVAVLLLAAGSGAAYYATRGDGAIRFGGSASALDAELARTGRVLAGGDEATREAIRAVQRELNIEADGKPGDRVTAWLKDKPTRWSYSVAADGSADFTTPAAAVAHLDRVFDLASASLKNQAAGGAEPLFTLALRSGQYRANLRLRGPVRLQGDGPAASVVVSAAVADKPVVDAASRGGFAGQPALRGLSLRGGTGADVLQVADDSGGTRIEDNEIVSSGPHCGIRLSGEGKPEAAYRSLIGGNRLAGGCGISAGGTSRVLVANNAFSDLGGPALRLQGTADAELRDNTFRQVGGRLLSVRDAAQGLVNGGYWTASSVAAPALDVADRAKLTIRQAVLNGPDIHCVEVASAEASLLIENSRFGGCGGPRHAAVRIVAGAQAAIRGTVFSAVAGRGPQVSDQVDARPGERLALEGNSVRP